MARRPRGQLRQDILETVIELLIGTGDVDSVSIDSVVERVGCTPPALYYYFPTKTDLLRQACEAEFQKLADHIEADVAELPGGSVVQLVRRGYALLHWAGAHPALYRILFMGTRRTAIVTETSLSDDPSLRALAANIESAVADGLIKPQNVQLLTLSLWGTVHGFASLAVSFPMIPMPELEGSMRLAMESIGDRMLTECGRESWRLAERLQAGETASSAQAGRP
ncbi:TetR/AcrR family transcriptional regulator [Micropruina sp.]|uniref:TetR/AcrR family transcriptional regulator n=1 Tax=Micropruina sp. TaxID=2737536 RepID=UPI00263008E9|nr:TetR/AcrR family transcriptional regulator [Micropruina sp.]